VASNGGRERAERPEDLGRLFVQRANAGDLEGLVALYEPDAVLAFPRGKLTTGRDAIRREYEQFLAGKPTLDGESQRGLCFGDLALTSTRFTGGCTAEVARRQPDGTWLWVIDQPNVLG
jgi:ketosteroid isomerase-like protein